MMNKTYKYIQQFFLLMGVTALIGFTSCLGDLNQEDPNDESTDEIVNEEIARSFLAKIYSGFGLSGNKGPSGDETENDLQGGDQGSLVFLRGLISMQEYPTDEAIWNWSDQGIVELVNMNWNYTTVYAFTFYQRAMLNIRYCKEFLDVYTLESGIPNVELYRNEVRAIRALNYYFLIDLYGNPGVVWDDSPTGDTSWLPAQIGRTEVFNKIVEELIDLSENSNLPEMPSMATYGRMTKPVVWTILSKLYLNAEVYTGTAMYDKAASYAEKVMAAGFGLEENYLNLFCGENHLTAMKKKEIIFALPFDNVNAKSFGNTILLTTAAFGGEMNGNWFGVTGGWTCLKPRETLVKMFDDVPAGKPNRLKSETKIDTRYQFNDVMSYDKGDVVVPDASWPFDEVTGQILYNVKSKREVEAKMGDWNTGYLAHKFTNLGWDQAKVTPTDYPNTDFPMFRLADIYLMYAECAVRGAGDKSKALTLVNELRNRAYNNDARGQIKLSDLTLDFILDERARELYWEGHRRTDLIRFNKFTQGYSWPYKGGVEGGLANVDSKFNLYPFSDKDLTANPLIVQNPGYQSAGK